MWRKADPDRVHVDPDHVDADPDSFHEDTDPLSLDLDHFLRIKIFLIQLLLMQIWFNLKWTRIHFKRIILFDADRELSTVVRIPDFSMRDLDHFVVMRIILQLIQL